MCSWTVFTCTPLRKCITLNSSIIAHLLLVEYVIARSWSNRKRSMSTPEAWKFPCWVHVPPEDIIFI